MRQAKELTLEALADTRRWVRALKPLRMEGRTGVSALRALADSIGSADPRVAFTMTGARPDVHESTELVLHRVLQEGLTNALRHSRAYRVEVLLECSKAGPPGGDQVIFGEPCAAGVIRVLLVDDRGSEPHLQLPAQALFSRPHPAGRLGLLAVRRHAR